MLNIEEIKEQYPNSLHKFNRGLLREYLQYQILNIIYKHKIGLKLSFLGDTCLRIVYKSKRFSEDLDFDNKNLSYSEFKKLAAYIKKELSLLGFETEIKQFQKMAFHCYIKFPGLLYKHGLSPIKQEKVLIQVDTFDQEVNYKNKPFILDKFSVPQQILTTPKEIILSQKLWTITQRKRAKGRDFFDAMFLLQNTKPNIKFLAKKFKTKDFKKIKSIILNRVKQIDWDQLTKDLQPFVHQVDEAKKIRLFPEFLKQINLE